MVAVGRRLRIQPVLSRDSNPSPSEQPSAGGLRFAVVVSRYHEAITARLLEAAKETLKQHGCDEKDVTVVFVPGAFEIPLVAKRLAETGRYEAVICLGCVIRGETPHFEYVAGEAARGVAEAALSSGVPVTFGVITADTLEQAEDRAGGKAGNKGEEAAISAIEMAHVMRRLSDLDAEAHKVLHEQFQKRVASIRAREAGEDRSANRTTRRTAKPGRKKRKG